MNKDDFSNMTEDEIEELFADCHSNLQAPVGGYIYTPTCYGCRNYYQPANWWKDATCKVFGKPPRKYSLDDQYTCPYKVTND